jgi:uncharacterized protein (DUF58 family)
LTTELLDPEFVRELEALRRLLGARVRSGGSGARTSRRRGRGSEFEEHRPYAPGDDIARLDWLAFARTGQPVAKEHRADEDTILRVLLDGSASLGSGTPTKHEVATRIAASMAYLSLAAGQRVQLAVATDGRARVLPVHRGRPALGAILHELAAVVPSGKTRLEGAVEHVLVGATRPGMLLVLSDFFDEGDVVGALGRARHAGHELVLVQVLSPEELRPSLDGDVSLVDSETGEALDVTLDAATVAAYEKRLSALRDALAAFARRSGARYVPAATDEPLLGVVRRTLAAG